MPRLDSRRTIQDMPASKAYSLVYTTTFKRQLKLVGAKYHSLVRLLAFGEKDHDRLFIEGEEVEP
jgi:hypothetical protein